MNLVSLFIDNHKREGCIAGIGQQHSSYRTSRLNSQYSYRILLRERWYLSLTRLLLLKDAHESLYTKQAQQAMAVSDPAVRLQALNNLYKRLRGKDQVTEAEDVARTRYPQ
jgi:hypothetical protein